MDRSDGTSVNALSTAGALGVIEEGKVLVHGDRAVGAGTCTLGASDTAVGTHLTGKSTLIVVRATNSDDNAVLFHLDSAVRTVLCAKSATQ